MIERGEVIGSGKGSVDVRMEAGSSEACAECGHCSRVDKDGLVISDVDDAGVGASVGDVVEVEIPPGTDVRAGLIVYILPVVTLLVGYGVGRIVAAMAGWSYDATGAIFGILGVVAGMMLMRGRARRLFSSERFRPKVRAIITRGLAAEPGGFRKDD